MNKLSTMLASAASLALVACSDAAEETTPAAEEAVMADQMVNADTGQTIVEVAQANPDFSTLVSAVQSADLAATLSGPGPYTVFAPTNAAFEKVPQDTRTELMSPAGKADLSNILTYHVVEGEVSAQTLTDAISQAGESGYTINTVGGGTLTAMMQGGNVVLRDAAGNTATVVKTDVDASNGTVHAIDTVLMPS